jgi:hypothetical protein
MHAIKTNVYLRKLNTYFRALVSNYSLITGGMLVLIALVLLYGRILMTARGPGYPAEIYAQPSPDGGGDAVHKVTTGVILFRSGQYSLSVPLSAGLILYIEAQATQLGLLDVPMG